MKILTIFSSILIYELRSSAQQIHRGTVAMSDQYENWNAERAVDGNITTEANECQCCAATNLGNFPWFEIDLEVLSRIAHITVYGRTDNNDLKQSFNGLRIYPKRHNETTGVPIFVNNSTTYFLNITLEPPVITQYITLKQIEDRLLVICELQLFDRDCEDGHFGALCNQTCHCSGLPCNTVTGTCPSKTCLPGYQGNSCSEACGINTYGLNCSLPCGNCSGNATCDHVTGHCLQGCDPGYVGLRCNESCGINTYGLNCSHTCGKCSGNATCDHVTGHCLQGCDPGYVGITCNESCGINTYGLNCSHTCGKCGGHEACDHVTGHCLQGCNPGYVGILCNERTNQKQGDGFELSSGTLAAILCSSLLVLAFAIFATVLFRKGILKTTLCKKECQTNCVPLVQGQEIKKAQNMDITTSDNIGTEYYAFALRKEDIKIYQIWDYVHKGMENSCTLFYNEFESLPKGLQYECKDATEAKNRPKNRYKDICAYDENRVRLLPLAIDPSESDYINASYVDGYNKVDKFLASQGPTKETVNDFWRMIWQQQCNVIVMLTNVYENDEQKCLQYWPFDEEAVTFGNVVVKLLREEQHTDYFLRYLEIDDYDNCREIKHYHFTSWPDKATPDTTWSLVNFWRAVVEGSKTVASPIVVHCSAGVGRTGTFIALDNLYNQCICEGYIRPLQMVETLRKQRVNMVQNKEQYVFLHESVAETLNFGTHYITPGHFEEVYNYLIETAADGSKTNMEEQFDLIDMSLHDCESSKSAIIQQRNEAEKICELTSEEISRTELEHGMDPLYENVSTSADNDTHPKHVAEDKSIKERKRCLLNYKDEVAFILLPPPDGVDTLKGLFDVISTERVNTIIQLENEADRRTALISNNNLLHGINLKVKLEKEKDGLAKKDLSITFTKKDKDISAMSNIRLLEYFDWNTDDNTPKNTKGFCDLLSEIMSRQTAKSLKKTPIVLISSETTRCGLLCVALDEKTRITTEGNINIIESVKKIRKQERNFISSFAQYKFCYDLTKTAVQQSDLGVTN